MFISSKNRPGTGGSEKRYDDSVAIVSLQKQAAIAKKDSTKTMWYAIQLPQEKFLAVTKKQLTVENEVLSIVFTNKGGQASLFA